MTQQMLKHPQNLSHGQGVFWHSILTSSRHLKTGGFLSIFLSIVMLLLHHWTSWQHHLCCRYAEYVLSSLERVTQSQQCLALLSDKGLMSLDEIDEMDGLDEMRMDGFS